MEGQGSVEEHFVLPQFLWVTAGCQGAPEPWLSLPPNPRTADPHASSIVESRLQQVVCERPDTKEPVYLQLPEEVQGGDPIPEDTGIKLLPVPWVHGALGLKGAAS